MSKPRAYTNDEVRDRFLDHVASMVRYWRDEERRPEVTGKMVGLVHSILAAIDGCSDLPGFVLAASPHPDDEEFYRSEGENWYPPAAIEHDIAGPLHERWHDACRKAGLPV